MKIDDYLKATGKQDSAPVTFQDLRAIEEAQSPSPSPKKDNAPATGDQGPATTE